MPIPPTGTVTLLFSDVEGSTQLLHRLRDEYPGILSTYQHVLRSMIQKYDGFLVDIRGEEAFAAFNRARDALRAAVEAQLAILAHLWPDGVTIGVRMGLHTGEPSREETGYVGIDVHRAARICAAGHGGQILVSEVTERLLAGSMPEGITLVDLGEHRLKDMGHPLRIFQVIHAGLRSTFPPLNSLSLFPTNLPAQITSFIGRKSERAEVSRLLMSARLLTLVGPGGTGKTRLAIEVGGDVLPLYRDGVWWADLAPLSDPALIPNVVGSAMGLSEQPGRPILSTIIDHFTSRVALLVLDNCEHLIHACAEFTATLLRRCAGLRIIATSRENLAVPGELVFSVPPLSLPAGSSPRTADEMLTYEAVSLFVDRARLVLPTFALDDHMGTAILHLCQRLDGLPLAIELAAARMRALTLEEISARIDSRFRILVAEGPVVDPRHRTLQASIEWSYELLTKEEQTMFRRLAVFAGTFTLDAAEDVCAGRDIDRESILALVARLLDKSLLVIDIRGDAKRYRMLQTIREYAGARLESSGEAPDVRLLFLRWCAKLAELSVPELFGRHQAQWLDRVELEHDNLRYALHLAMQSEQRELFARLAGDLSWFWFSRGYLTEGVTWLRSALSADTGISSASRCKALAGAAMLSFWLGDLRGTRAYGEEGLHLCRETSDKTTMQNLLITLGNEALNRDPKRSMSFFEEGLSVAQELNDAPRIGMMLQALGHIAKNEKDYERARAHYEKSYSYFSQHGYPGGIANVLAWMGLLAVEEGNYEKANSLGEESLALFRQLQIKRGIALACHVIGRASFQLGDPGRAETFHREALTLRWGLRNIPGVSHSLVAMASMAALRKQSIRAVRLFAIAEALRKGIGEAPVPRSFGMYPEVLKTLRETLGASEFARAWTEGQEMSIEEAIEYALENASVSVPIE